MVSVYLYDTTRLKDNSELIRRCNQASESRIEGAFKYLFNDNPDLNTKALFEGIINGNLNADRKSVYENIGASAVLNEALNKYGLDEKTEDFCYGQFGKPYLKNHPEININLSHSGIYVICALSDKEVGIDIQKIGKPHIKLARRFFTASEYNDIISQKDASLVQSMFYRYWALKESFVKTVGRGMDIDFRNFEIEIIHNDSLCDSNNNIKMDEVNGYYSISENVSVRQQINNQSYVFYEFNVSGYAAALCTSVTGSDDMYCENKAELILIK